MKVNPLPTASKHATVPRDGFTVPIIGIAPSATEEHCDGCGEPFHITHIKLWRGQFLCTRCLAMRLNNEAAASVRATLETEYKVDEAAPPTKPPGAPKDNGPTKRLVHQLFKKQNGCCYYCGLATEAKQRTKDHKIPRCRGGRNHANYVGACKPCNAAKGSMTVDEFLDTDYLPNSRRAQLGREAPPSIKFFDAQKLHGERMKNYISRPKSLPVHYRTSWPEGYKTNVW